MYKDGKELSKADIWDAMENIRLCLKYISECILKNSKTFIYAGFPCFSDIDSKVRALKEYVINSDDYELAKKLASYERTYFSECGDKWYSEDKQRYRKLLSVQLDLYDVYKWLLTEFFRVAITDVDRYFMRDGRLFERNTEEEIFPKGHTAEEASLPDNAAEEQQPKIPEELRTKEAVAALKKAVRARLLNADYSPTELTKTKAQKALLAECISDEAGIKNKWKPFENLWGVKNLAQQRNKSKDVIGKVNGGEPIMSVFGAYRK